MGHADNDNSAGTVLRSQCPICGKPATLDSRPFCSPRCKDVDLHRWLGGRYAIPGGNSDADEDGDDAVAAMDAEAVQTGNND